MNNYYYEVTNHSFIRSKERCNVKNRKSAANRIRNAYVRGKHADDFTSWEKDYLDRKILSEITPVVYNNMCYLFAQDQKCVTILELPAWFGKKKHFAGKARIRNYKKYMNGRSLYEDGGECIA